MECQVNASADGGNLVTGEYHGVNWRGWTDNLTTWKSFRIPWKAKSKPEFTDSKMTWDLLEHTEAIGMTGWDWKNLCSRWVAFDFDSMINHEQGLTQQELQDIEDTMSALEFTTIRKSTSGKGLHVYIFLDNVPTKNHNEHAALARAILGYLSATTGYNFETKIDACGGNMWVWHRKMQGTDGLTLIKQGTVFKDIPKNWRDHVKVVNGTRRKNLPQDIEGSPHKSEYEEIVSQHAHAPLDEGHRKLINYLREIKALWWWDPDHHMLVTHTGYLQRAFRDMKIKGFFKTDSASKNLEEQNCFAFPQRKGAWTVRRYTPGVNEHISWSQDGSGWTRCYFNKDVDFKTACRSFGGVEDRKSGYRFRDASSAQDAAMLMNVDLKLEGAAAHRAVILRQHKDGRLIAEAERTDETNPDDYSDWYPEAKKFMKVYNAKVANYDEIDSRSYDDLIRHIISTGGQNLGWLIKSENIWREEPLVHVKIAFGSMGFNPKEITNILGSSIFQAWRLVNKPFQPEYPGDREWNRHAAQLKYKPTKNLENLRHPTWDRLLSHCGEDLDDILKHNAWAKNNGIITGGDYLRCWIASVFQEPTQPLPYLFLFGPQNSGKSILHEALRLLLTKGYKHANATMDSDFNAELDGAIICVIEEMNLGKNHNAYNKIKNWVTSRELLIHEKRFTPYQIVNTTHWIHCANDHKFCPVFPGDSRITMLNVPMLSPVDMIPKRKMEDLLEKEASDFLATVMNLEIPESNDRLNVPVIETESKGAAQRVNQTLLEQFIDENCTIVNGEKIKMSEFAVKFHSWLDPDDVSYWTKNRVGKELPLTIPKGRQRKDNQVYIGNIQWENKPIPTVQKNRIKLDKTGKYLEMEIDEDD